jgi:hypothetical protein
LDPSPNDFPPLQLLPRPYPPHLHGLAGLVVITFPEVNAMGRLITFWSGRLTPAWPRTIPVHVLLLSAVVFGGPLGPVTSAALPNKEQELKAAALYNIIIFTEWPTTAFATPDAPLVVGTIGQGPVAGLLGDVLANETCHGRRIVFERYTTVAQAQSCHVLYIAQSEHNRWPAMRGQFFGRPVLTVADADTFARDGGVVQFAIERNRLKLIVNLETARRGGLMISSKVLRLANVIGEAGP